MKSSDLLRKLSISDLTGPLTLRRPWATQNKSKTNAPLRSQFFTVLRPRLELHGFLVHTAARATTIAQPLGHPLAAQRRSRRPRPPCCRRCSGLLGPDVSCETGQANLPWASETGVRTCGFGFRWVTGGPLRNKGGSHLKEPPKKMDAPVSVR